MNQMDEDISRWVMEFLLRHSPSDQLINKILTKLPISNNNFRLKKTLLLRSIQAEISDGSVSETTLDNLKTIQDLDKNEGITTTGSMKAACCVVAVDCTVKYLEESVDKHEIQRIWRGKIGNLEESVTPELSKWKDEIEEAINDDVCRKLLKKNTRNHALRLVRDYLREAWGIMGPAFLELAVGQLKVKESDGGDDFGGRGVTKQNGKATYDFGGRGVTKQNGIQKENVVPKRKHIAAHRRTRGPVKITDNEELETDGSCSKYDTVPTPEVSKVQEALKWSSLELKAIVTDPLPDALLRAETVVSDVARENQNQGALVEKQIDGVKNVPNGCGNASVKLVQGNEDDCRNQICGNQNNVSNRSLMERNSTAHTYEWDDLIDDSQSPEGPSTRSRRFHLPSPKRKAVSPLKKHESTKFARRRKMKRWSVEEEEALRNGVQAFGMGNWKHILKSNPEAFEERTEVDLKDKWRNMRRY